MSVKALVVATALGILAWPAAARAEKAKANQITKVFIRAGEQSTVVANVQPGQIMTVLAKDGRWIKVRVSGRTGWVPRTKVDLATEDDVVDRTTRGRPFVDGRGTKRGFGGELGPDDRVGADATGEGADPQPVNPGDPNKPDKEGSDAPRPLAHVSKDIIARAEPNATSEPAFTAKPKAPLYVVEEKGKWMFIENEEGDAGYLLAADLTVERATVTAADPLEGGRRRMVDLHGRVGASLIRQDLTSSASSVAPDTYAAQSASLTLAVGFAALFPFGQRGWFGLELGYDYNMALGGVPYNGKSNGFTYHVLNTRLGLGYQTQRPSGLIILPRLGYHYDGFQVANLADFTKNTLTLPNQNIMAPTIGLAFVMPHLSRRVSFTLGVDAIVALATVQQTKNLEDGTKPNAKAVYLGLALGYRLSAQTAFHITYDLGYTAVSFGGPPPAGSLRGHMMAEKMSGTDLNNILSFGLLYSL